MTTKLMNNVNDRTYQEVEYLKKSLGPVLVAALAEICIRRPADPIEYLGHWLLRWRYNEELKRRDVVNAMDVVKQRQWSQVKEDTLSNLQKPDQIQPEQVAQYTPDDMYKRGLVQDEEYELENNTEEEMDTETLFASQDTSPKLSLGATQKKGSTDAAKKSLTSPKGSLGGGSEGRKMSDKKSIGGGSRKTSKDEEASGSRKGSNSTKSDVPPSSEMTEEKRSSKASDSLDSESTKRQSVSTNERKPSNPQAPSDETT